MQARKISRLRRLINEPSYPLRRLETLQDQFAALAWSWLIGRDVEVTGRGMERTSRKIDRVKGMIINREMEINRERIHEKYLKEE